MDGGGYGEAMEEVQHTRRTTAAIVLGLVVLPICAVPLYLGGLGSHVARRTLSGDEVGCFRGG
jgi:hypothetical protein